MESKGLTNKSKVWILEIKVKPLDREQALAGEQSHEGYGQLL
jgi:hypothetical protein